MTRSWGMPPSRGPGLSAQAIVKSLRYTPEVDANGSRSNRIVSRFSHPVDSRIWTGRLTPLSAELEGLRRLRCLLTLNSSGCREMLFACLNIPCAKTTISHFIHATEPTYRVLTADARPTSDHPRRGNVRVVHVEVDGTTYPKLGWVSDRGVHFFPLADILEIGMQQIADDSAYPIIDPSVNKPELFRAGNAIPYTPEFSPEELASRLMSGELRLPEPRAREGRSIELD